MKLPAIRINPLGMLVLTCCALFLTFAYVSRWYERNKLGASISLKHLLAVGISAAEAGGRKVRDVHKESDLKQRSKGKTKEGANDPLTEGDVLSHQAMMQCLQKTFPKLQVISEEHDETAADEAHVALPSPRWDAIQSITDDIEIPLSDVVVWIDPLDATQEYTENLIEYVTTMVCVAVRGIPVIGIIHLPFENVTEWAWVNHGVSDIKLDDSVKDGSFGKVAHVIVSRSHAGKVGEVAKAAFGPETIVTTAGGAGYKILQVAKGKASAYVHVTLIKKWDICAGSALITAMGGHMTDLDGLLINYGNPEEKVNAKGLLATLRNHREYLDKLSNVKG